MATTKMRGITIDIGADTTGLKKALSDINTEVRTTSKELKDVERLLKLDPTNVTLMAQKQKYLTDAIQETKLKLEALKNAEGELAIAAANGGEKEKAAYEAVQREIIATEQKLKDLEKQAASSSIAMQKISGVGQKMQDVGSSIESVGNKLMPLSLGLTAVGTASVKAATDWESAFAEVRKTVQGTEEDYAMLSDGIKEMATTTASSAEDIALVVAAAGKLGIAKDDVLEFSKTMVMLGDSTNLSAEEAATSLAKFINITGDSAKDINKLGSALTDLGNKFATNESDILNMSLRMASAGTIAGLTSTDIMALATAMSSVGIRSEAGGSAFAKTLTQMEKAVAEFTSGSSDSLEQIANIAGMTADSFAQSWKEKPIVAIQAFLKGLGELDEKGESATLVLDELGMSGIRQENMLKALGLASDEVARAIDTSNTAYKENTALTERAEKQYATFAAKLSQFKETIKQAGQAIGIQLIPILESLMEKVKKAAKAFTELPDGVQNLIVKIGVFLAALAPVLVIGGKITDGIGIVLTKIAEIPSKLNSLISFLPKVASGFNSLFTAIAMNPVIDLLVIAIGTLVAAFATLWQTNEDFRNSIIEIWDGIKEKFDEFGQGIVERLNALGYNFKDIVEVLKTVWEGFCNFLAPIFEGVFNVISIILGTALDILTGLFDVFSGIFTGNWELVWTGIKEIFEGILNGIYEFFYTKFNTIKEVFGVVLKWMGTTWEEMWTSVKNFFVNIWNDISGFVQYTIPMIINDIINWFSQLPGRVWEWLVSTVRRVQEWGSNLWSSAKNAALNMVDAVIGTISSLPGRLYDWGVDMIEGLIQGIKNMIWRVRDAASSVADAIAEFLHFSRPDVGPLHEYEKWMPDMMKGLAKGIKDNIWMIDDAVNKVSDKISMGINVPDVNFGNRTLKSTIYLEQPILLDGKQIANSTQRYITRQQTSKLKAGGAYA